MQDPVRTCDGRTYERESIEMWLRRRSISPSTGLELRSRSLAPNIGMRKAIAAFLHERPEIERAQFQQKSLDSAAQRLGEEMAGKLGEQSQHIQALLAHIDALQAQVRSLGAEPVPAPASSLCNAAAMSETTAIATPDYTDSVARLSVAKREAVVATAEAWASAMVVAGCDDASCGNSSHVEGDATGLAPQHGDPPDDLVHAISDAVGCLPEEAFQALRQTGTADGAVELLLSGAQLAAGGIGIGGTQGSATVPLTEDAPPAVGGQHGEVLQMRLVAMQQALSHLQASQTLGDANVTQLMRDEVQRLHDTMLA